LWGVMLLGGATWEAPAQAELRPTCAGVSGELSVISYQLAAGDESLVDRGPYAPTSLRPRSTLSQS
jgi:hypothetical protein